MTADGGLRTISAVRRYDAVIVGAGPAGSVSAYRLASAGARVLMLDRAAFPRDKPCGGGLTGRALRELPIDVGPVIEKEVDRFEFRLRYGPAYARTASGPLIAMTRRARLDHHLAERAAAAGAEFHDSVRVTDVTELEDGYVVRAGSARFAASTMVGADGVNGVCARALGLGSRPTYGVALEGDVVSTAAEDRRYAATAVFELGTVPGGYGWAFPKEGRINLGVGGWQREGPSLRGHLEKLCAAHGIDPARLEGVVGYRLPLRKPDAALARRRALLVGDAAGLVDPISGDGMFECFVSARVASDAVVDLLSGAESSVEPYAKRLERRLCRLTSASWSAKIAFDRFPWLSFQLTRPGFVWPIVEALIRGEIDHPGSSRGLGRTALKLLDAGSRRLTGGQRIWHEPGPSALG